MDALAPWAEELRGRARTDSALTARLNVHAEGLRHAARHAHDTLHRLKVFEAAEAIVRHLARHHPDLALRVVAAAGTGTAQDTGTAALSHLRAAWVLLEQGPEVRALGELEQARAHSARCACSALRLLVLVQFGRLLVIAGDAPRAIVTLQEGADLAARLGARREEAKLLGNLGFLYGDTDGTAYEAYTRRALGIAREIGDTRLIALSLCNLGGALVQQGRYEDARACLDEGAPIARANGLSDIAALFDAALGGLHASTGDMDTALRAYRRSSDHFAANGDTFQVSRQHVTVARHLVRAGRFAEARERAEQGLGMTLAEGGETHHTVAWQAHTVLADALEGMGDVRGALVALRAANARRERLLEDRSAERLRLLTLQGDIERTSREAAEARARAVELERSLAEQSALREGFEHLVRTDALTGLYNRRHVHEIATKELARMGRSWRPMCVALIDADAFKSVNDTHGHAAGDDVLVEIGKVLREGLRDGDIAARWGGEEFCAILPDTDAAGGLAAMERLLRALRETPLATRASPIRVTASVGVAAARKGDRSLDALLTRAYGALYAAKRAGRDRALLAPTDDPGSTLTALP
jgi:diguanylate cyclase (GGDEF)-like protein